MKCRGDFSIRNMGLFCLTLLWGLLAISGDRAIAFAASTPTIEATLDAALSETETFLNQCRQKEEIVPDSEYDRLFKICGEATSFSLSSAYALPKTVQRKWLALRLDEVEICTFQAIDGYLGDLYRIRIARTLLGGCENAMKSLLSSESDAQLTGRALYLRASILMLEAYRLSRLPHFEEILPLLEKACTLLGDHPKDEILALHALGRACANLALAGDTSEERYRELTGKAERAFKSALRFSSRQGDFMRTLLLAQLGNTLNNMDRTPEALDILKDALDRVDPNDEPSRFLALHLDIAQALTGVYLETLAESDLHAAKSAADRALLVSNSLRSAVIVPHVRFNLAMTLSTIAEETQDSNRNAQAIFEIEKVLAVWTFERFINLHLMATDTLGSFLDLQESLTRDVRFVDRAIVLIEEDLSFLEKDASLSRTYREVLGNLYERLSELYFKRALHETGRKQQETWDLSKTAEKRARELRNTPSQE